MDKKSLQIYEFAVEEGTKCGGCNWETSRMYVLADSKEEAEKCLARGEVLCGACMAEMLAEEGYRVYHPSDQE